MIHCYVQFCIGSIRWNTCRRHCHHRRWWWWWWHNDQAIMERGRGKKTRTLKTEQRKIENIAKAQLTHKYVAVCRCVSIVWSLIWYHSSKSVFINYWAADYFILFFSTTTTNKTEKIWKSRCYQPVCFIRSAIQFVHTKSIKSIDICMGALNLLGLIYNLWIYEVHQRGKMPVCVFSFHDGSLLYSSSVIRKEHEQNTKYSFVNFQF